MEDIREKVLSSKWFVLALVLVLGIMVFSIMAKVISTTTYKKTPVAAISKVVTSQQLCLDGQTWKAIDNFQISPMDKVVYKISLCRVLFEASYMNGKPVITSAGSLVNYVRYLDVVYNDPRNLRLPLFFGLKIAEMADKKMPAAAIDNFRNSVMQKLAQMGLIK